MYFRPKNTLTCGLSILSLGLLLIHSAVAEKIRLVGGNISSGNLQSYDPGHGARIFQGLKPDVVMIQEFNYGNNSVTAIRQFVDSTFGTSFSYYRETGAQIPNGIISRYPIIESGEWTDQEVSNRDFAWARIDIPGPEDLWAVSVHFLTRSSSVRNTEATALVAYIKSRVPDSDYLVIGGDFNSDSRSEAQFMTLGNVVDTSAPHPADRNSNQGTNASRAKPYDSVFADKDLRQHQIPVVIGNSTFPNGLVADTRVYTPISEISPALPSDSSSTNMQHMAIVKDFDVPVDPIIASSPTLTPGKAGVAYSQNLSATSGKAPYIWTITSGNIPGLTLTGVGNLSGTPTSAGSYNINVKVTDAASGSATKTFNITVTPPLLITSPSTLPDGTTGSDYSYPLTSSGGSSPSTWAIVSGNLPGGLNLDGGGIISGTPSASGTFNFTAKVRDSSAFETSKSFSIKIISALAINPTPAPASGTVGASYSQALTVSGGTSSYTWIISTGALPPGINLSNTGVINGTPTAAGTFNFTARVDDSMGASTSGSFSVTVLEPVTRFLEFYGLATNRITEDSDEDGIVNLTEFILGGNPTLHDPSILPVLARDPGTGSIIYTFRVLNATGSATWKIEYSSDLLTWNTATSGEQGAAIIVIPDGTMSSVTATIPAASGSMFVRLSVVQP